MTNLLRGFVWLAILVTGYFLAKKYMNFDLEILLGPLYENTVAIYSIFLVSEVVFGIIPPEFFMFWALRHELLWLYVQNVAALATMSYLAGVIGYFIGSFLNRTVIYRMVRRNYLGKYEELFNNYGGFLILVAAITPLPFSGICMLVGAVKYPIRKFFWIALTRFGRFVVYSMIIWEANVLN
ncbi:MAG: membrane protein DedA with SNARE-associated domain [Cyclobacteriaceae bacterium]|jgi:membrane protein DedA with SNARE-associated domain